jgi:protein-disulfide isomerase
MNKKALYLSAVAVALVAAAALVTISVVGTGGNASTQTTAASEPAIYGVSEAHSLFAGIPQKGSVLGSPQAPVTLVEYADAQCPYCAQWALEALPTIVRDYVRSGKVRIEFRPLAFIGTDSRTGAGAIIAAGMRSRMYQAMHILYANQGSENSGWINESLLGSMALELGLNRDQFAFDRDSSTVDRAIQKAQQAAAADGITGTPSFLAGKTGSALQPVEVTSLDAAAMRPVLDRLLAA